MTWQLRKATPEDQPLLEALIARSARFFVDPAHARQGIGRALLERCEDEARRCGFSRFELMATLPGRKLYAVFGYLPGPSIRHPLGPGLTIEFVPMRKGFASGELA